MFDQIMWLRFLHVVQLFNRLKEVVKFALQVGLNEFDGRQIFASHEFYFAIV